MLTSMSQTTNRRIATPLGGTLALLITLTSLTVICPARAAAAGAPEIAVSIKGNLHNSNDELQDLGEVFFGRPNMIRLRIVNPGKATLQVTEIRFGGDDGTDFQLSDPTNGFSVAPTGALSRGEFLDFVLTPSHRGLESGVMTISNNSATPAFKLNLRATAVIKPALQLSVNNQTIGDGGTFDFGSITRDQAQSGTIMRGLELKNAGNAPLTISSHSITDKFGVDNGSFPNSAFTLAPDQARASVIFFGVFGTLVGPGPREGDLTIVNNSDHNPFTLHLKVNILGPRIDVRINDVSALTTGGHDFGSVIVGQTASATLTIASLGSESLTGQLEIATLGNTQDYRLGATVLSFALNPGETFTSPITVTPAAVGSITGTLTILSNAGNFGLQLATQGIDASQVRDCNHNGIDDGSDIATGVSRDCNANNIPDECELDSDGNGVIDACEAGAPPSIAPTIPTAPLNPGDAADTASDPGGNTTLVGNDDASRVTSTDGNETAARGNDSNVAVPSAGLCGVGSASLLPMMAVAFCGMRSGRARRRHVSVH